MRRETETPDRVYIYRSLKFHGPGSGGGGAGSTLNQNLVAHWHFDEASGTRVDSVSGMNLTQTGTVNSNTGKLGNAAAFTGSAANYLRRNASLSAIDWPANVQFECNLWFWLNVVTGADQFLFNIATGVSSNTCSLWWFGSDRMQFFANGRQMAHTPSGLLSTNTWYNASWGFDGTNTFCYINNANRVTGAPMGTGPGVATEIIVGVQPVAINIPLNGRIDCCSLWLGRCLTTTERTDLYNSGAGKDYPYT